MLSALKHFPQNISNSMFTSTVQQPQTDEFAISFFLKNFADDSSFVTLNARNLIYRSSILKIY